jgi:hypothetical protein
VVAVKLVTLFHKKLKKMANKNVTKFCASVKNCQCPSKLKNSFFTELKRFGIQIFIEGDTLRLVNTKTASKGEFTINHRL